MPLNPQVEAMLAAMAAFPAPDFAVITPEQMRAVSDQPMAQGPAPEVAKAQDMEIPLQGRTLAARLYVPNGVAERPGLTLYFHGGGWVIGTLETHDTTCRALARASGNPVLSVAYRLAPEHRYPAAVEDCYDALVWARDNAAPLGIDPDKLAVAGDSAGGNLAAAVAIAARDRAGPGLRHQFLAYPVTARDFTLPSYQQNGSGEFFLSTASMEWFWNHYLGEMSAEAAPLAAILDTPDLSGLPEATVITAEFDPLRDEGMLYAARLRDAGVEVDADVAPGMIHGFISMFEAVPDAMPWIERAGSRLRAALA